MATMTEHVALNENMGEGLKLQVSKVIRAKRERVFEAWTKPEGLQSWFGPEGTSDVKATVDLRVGGGYRIEMKRPARANEASQEPVTVAAEGLYDEIVANERLRFTWRGSWMPHEETVVTVGLKDVVGGTEVTVTHERFMTTESMAGHEHGWLGSLAKMVKVLEA